uniref:hypothetical protein n=1 Tax=Methylobacterium sp. B34 TaxID=95563 RepID=UPI00034AC9EF|nr:hypothetical protein [Methylobacterium sp. B34]
MIHVGDGKHIVIVEGALQPPPVLTSGIKHPNRRKAAPIPRKVGTGPARGYYDVPGWRAYHSRSFAEIKALAPPGRLGKPPGVPDGFRKHEIEALRKRILNNVMTDEDISVLIASIKETDPIAAFAMSEMIKLAAAPGALRDRAMLLKTILEFTKSKPALKSEVNIAQQDNWAMMLEEVRTTPITDESK